MAVRIFYVISFLIMATSVNGQEISRQEVDSMIKDLNKPKNDADQIELLLNVAQFYIFKPGENQIDFDSATIYIDKAKELNKKINSPASNGYLLLTESYLVKEKGPKSENLYFTSREAKKMVEKAITILEASNNKLFLGKAYFELSNYYGYNDTKELEERIRLLEKALSYFQQTRNMERIGTSLYVLGDLYQIHDDLYKSMQYLRNSLVAFDSAHHLGVQGVYTLMGGICLRQGDNKAALNYELLALQTAQKVGDTSIQLCQINNEIASTFTRLNKYPKAISYFNDALKVAEKYHDVLSIYFVAASIALAWTDLGRADEALRLLNTISLKYKRPEAIAVDFNIFRANLAIYEKLGNYDKAKYYCDKMLALAEREPAGSFESIASYQTVIQFYITSGQYKLALKYLNQLKTLSDKNKDMNVLVRNQMLWFTLDTSQHDYRGAIDHLLNRDQLKDSLFNATKSRQIEELQIAYETDKKQKDIQLKDQSIQLLTKQDELQKSKLQQGALLRNISFAVLALLIIIIALLYNRYRLKQRTNKKLELQQQEITKQNLSLQQLVNEKDWLVKEIHHRVKNNLQIVMSLLNSQSAYIKNDAALIAIHDSQHRVHAMSLIHQKLYNTENVSTINISSYVRELCSYLVESFDAGQRVSFQFDVASLQLDVSQAVPLGLILNEAITNSIKYAFPNGRRGVISITLKNTSTHHYVLIISDDGVGMPSNFNRKKLGSLGMNLMEGLSEDLDGDFSIENNHGTTIKISFIQHLSVRHPETLTASLA